MAIVIETEDGAVCTLPSELALDDHELSIETPGAEMPRRHGALRFDAWKQVQPRRLTVSGSIKGINKADADRLAAELNARLMGSGVLKLYRTAGSDQFIYCEAREIRYNPHRGHFGASLFTLSITLEALDPWFYMVQQQGVLRLTSASGEQWTVNHPGTDREQPTVVHIANRWSGTLINPRLECLTTGSVLLYTGSIAADQVLVVDTERRKAALFDYTGVLLGGAEEPVGNNVWNSLNPGWQAKGFRLAPGENTIAYTDDAASNHQARIYLEFRPRSW